MRYWQVRHRLAAAGLLTVLATVVGLASDPPAARDPRPAAAPARDAGPGEPGARGGDGGPGNAGRGPGDAAAVPGDLDSWAAPGRPGLLEAADAFATLSTLEGMLLYGGDDLRVRISKSPRGGRLSVLVLLRREGRVAERRTYREGTSLRAVLGEALVAAYEVDLESKPRPQEEDRRWGRRLQ